MTCVVGVSTTVWPSNLTRNASLLISPASPTILMNPPLCSEDLNLLVFVCTAVGNQKERKAIRETWANPETLPKGVKVSFMVGRDHVKEREVALAREGQLHGDIIQEDFQDSYANLTLKSLFILKYVRRYCRQVPYVLKTDDDMFINVHNLKSVIDKNNRSDLLLGRLICGASAIRDPYNKWFAPQYMYDKKNYPNYLSGTAYAFSQKVAGALLEKALQQPIFHLEDIYITGMLAKEANLKPMNNVGFSFSKHHLSPCLYSNIISSHHLSIDEMYVISKKLTYGQLCSKSRSSRLRFAITTKCK